MKPVKTLLIAAFSLACCSGASFALAAEEITPLTYDASVTDIPAVKLSNTCNINIVQISDQRFSKENLGTEMPVPITAAEPWLESGFGKLKEYGFNVQRNNQAAANALNLYVRLIRAYTWFGDLRINSMVAMDVDFDAEGQNTEKFRATGSKTNMVGAKSEHVTAINYALNHTIHKMAQSLQTRCAQVK